MKNREIFEKLRNWRNALAASSGMAPYRILSNNALELVAKNLPKSKDDFLRLKGWGEKNFNRYGNEVLDIIKEYQQKSNQDDLASRGICDVFDNLQSPSKEDQAISNFESPIFSVKEFMEIVNDIFQNKLGKIKIKGELGQISGREKGYAFFDFFDKENQEIKISCFASATTLRYYGDFLKEGNEVVIEAIGSLYFKTGRFSLNVLKIEPIGEGAWKIAFEKLKTKLEKAGYFSPERKRTAPFFIEKIGLITSKDGAAINDFIRNLGNGGYEIFLENVFVEGDQAEESIIEAIKRLNQMKKLPDVIVLIRGGGGWESFKAFNSEKVAEAIVSSRVPIISGIGHEKDVTIAGLSADLNFSTPTAAADFLKNHLMELKSKITGLKERLENDFQLLFLEHNNKIRDLSFKMEKSLAEKINRIEYNLGFLSEKIQKLIERMFFQLNQVTEGFEIKFKWFGIFLDREMEILQKNQERLLSKLEDHLSVFENKLLLFESKLDGINPKRILKKGYSVIFKNGEAVKSVKEIKKDQLVKAEFFDGKAVLRTEEIYFD